MANAGFGIFLLPLVIAAAFYLFLPIGDDDPTSVNLGEDGSGIEPVPIVDVCIDDYVDKGYDQENAEQLCEIAERNRGDG